MSGPDERVDAVVIGAGHHGLVAAATLADAGWDVLVLEGRDDVGGAVHSRVRDGWVQDEFSACHPLAVASPVLQALDLGGHGLQWSHAPSVVAHVGEPGQPAAVMHRDAEDTAHRLAADHAEDGEAWLRIVDLWRRVREPLLASLLTRWPPVRGPLGIVQALGPAATADFVRMALLPVHQLGQEWFEGQAARDLLLGNAMHADIPPTAPGSGLFGWIMSMLAQDVGFPSPTGGTRMLAQALRQRAEIAGAQVRTGVHVARIVATGGAVHGVVTADGRRIAARRAVIGDVSAPDLYGRLLPADAIPSGLRQRLEHFTWDYPTVKVNFRLESPVPWTDPAVGACAVVHAGHSGPAMLEWSGELERGQVPQRPFALVGQMTTVDKTRSPKGTETLWAYTHLPRGCTDSTVARAMADRTQQLIESLAPGFGDTVIDRWDQLPDDLHGADPNLGEGAVGGGTSQLFQQAIFRPVLGLGGPRTHLDRLYLGSAAIHPGGGVHGGCGYLAARAALNDQRWWGRPRRHLELGLLHRLYEG